MTIIEGQTETLKKLKEALIRSGITRFDSIGQIRRFLRDFEAEKDQLPSRIESDLDAEIRGMKSTLASQKQACNELRTKIQNEIDQQLRELRTRTDKATKKSNRNGIFRFLYFLKLLSLSHRTSKLKKNRAATIERRTVSQQKAIAKLESEIEGLRKKENDLVAERCKKSLDELIDTKEVVDGLYPLVAGAIGETSVVKTLSKLSDDYYLINDFSLEFDPPIYNRKENDRIFSIQIDHLLVCPSGVFLLETKNWSKASVENLDLRSPVQQILRTSFALFVLLNSDSRMNDLRLERHHWGDKKISIRNVIVMINQKPRQDFKHVKVVSLNELIGYIRYFDPIFDVEEVKSIVEYLRRKI